MNREGIAVNIRSWVLLALMLSMSVSWAAHAADKTIVILATGGTIAVSTETQIQVGYTSG